MPGFYDGFPSSMNPNVAAQIAAEVAACEWRGHANYGEGALVLPSAQDG
jgi:hypothetical protein